MLGNKGGVAVSCTIAGASLCLACGTLPPSSRHACSMAALCVPAGERVARMCAVPCEGCSVPLAAGQHFRRFHLSPLFCLPWGHGKGGVASKRKCCSGPSRAAPAHAALPSPCCHCRQNAKCAWCTSTLACRRSHVVECRACSARIHSPTTACTPHWRPAALTPYSIANMPSCGQPHGRAHTPSCMLTPRALPCACTGTRIMLVTCHLAAHSEQVKRRNADYTRIAAGLFKAGSVSGPPGNAANAAAAQETAAPVVLRCVWACAVRERGRERQRDTHTHLHTEGR